MIIRSDDLKRIMDTYADERATAERMGFDLVEINQAYDRASTAIWNLFVTPDTLPRHFLAALKSKNLRLSAFTLEEDGIDTPKGRVRAKADTGKCLSKLLLVMLGESE